MQKPIHILLVEDNDGDILLTTETIEKSKVLNRISTVKDGKEAIDFLIKKGKYENCIEPDLLLLDINLPKKNGLEVLQFIKKNETLKHIPVIMLSTSSSERDISLAEKYNASYFITKPLEVNTFTNAVKQIINT